MKSKQTSIDSDVITRCLQEYNSHSVYDTTSMNKSPPGKVLDELTEICSMAYGKHLFYKSGNFYKHTDPYLPHTDYKTFQDNSINVVIPLEYVGTKPYLVIFDQEWPLDSITWCMHHPVQYFTTNIGVKGCPHEYPVSNLTGKEIDNDLYKNYLSHYPSRTLFGLSGNAYPFEPGSIILFDNKRIHCTSSFSGIKTGISLRFSAEY